MTIAKRLRFNKDIDEALEQKLEQKLEEKLEQKLGRYPTKDEFYVAMDKLMKEKALYKVKVPSIRFPPTRIPRDCQR